MICCRRATELSYSSLNLQGKIKSIDAAKIKARRVKDFVQFPFSAI